MVRNTDINEKITYSSLSRSIRFPGSTSPLVPSSSTSPFRKNVLQRGAARRFPPFLLSSPPPPAPGGPAAVALAPLLHVAEGRCPGRPRCARDSEAVHFVTSGKREKTWIKPRCVISAKFANLTGKLLLLSIKPSSKRCSKKSERCQTLKCLLIVLF